MSDSDYTISFLTRMCALRIFVRCFFTFLIFVLLFGFSLWILREAMQQDTTTGYVTVSFATSAPADAFGSMDAELTTTPAPQRWVSRAYFVTYNYKGEQYTRPLFTGNRYENGQQVIVSVKKSDPKEFYILESEPTSIKWVILLVSTMFFGLLLTVLCMYKSITNPKQACATQVMYRVFSSN